MRESTRRCSIPPCCSIASPTCRRPSKGFGSLHEAKIDAAAVQFGEIGVDGANLRVQSHPHWHHHISGQQRRVPDYAVARTLVLLGCRGAAKMARHQTRDGAALQTLTVLGREHLLSGISENQIVAIAAVKNRCGERACLLGGDLALESEIRGKVVDGAACCCGRDRV